MANQLPLTHPQASSLKSFLSPHLFQEQDTFDLESASVQTSMDGEHHTAENFGVSRNSSPVQSFGSTLDLLNQKRWGWAPAICDLTHPASIFWCQLKSENHCSNSSSWLLPQDLGGGWTVGLVHYSQHSSVISQTPAEILAPQRVLLWSPYLKWACLLLFIPIVPLSFQFLH